MCFSCFRPAPPSPVPQKRVTPQPQPMAEAAPRKSNVPPQEMKPLSIPTVQPPTNSSPSDPVLENAKQSPPAAARPRDKSHINNEGVPVVDSQDKDSTPASQPSSLSVHEQLAQLRDAVKRGDIECIQRGKALWSTCDADGSCAAHWTVSSGQVALLNAMLTADSEQAEPGAFLVKDAHGCLAIHRCISQSPVSLEVLSALLKHDSVCRQTIKLLTDSEDSVATLAFKHDEPAALKLLFHTITDLGTARFLLLEHRLGDQALLDTAIAAAEAKPNHARVAVSAAHGLGLLDVSAHTARAIQRDDIHGFRLILSVDPSSTISSSLGSTSVLKAICSSQSKHINEFLTAVKDAVLSKSLDITETVAGALEFAVGHGFAQVVEALLAFPGANDACKKSDLTDDGTLLHHAVALNQHQIVKLLLPASASVANKEDYHPLHLAVMSGNVQLVDLLLERFKNVDQVGPSGQTAMHLAILHAPALVIPRLAAFGASPNAADASGYTPLHYANRAKHPESVHALVLAGARGDVRTPDGLTPLLTALASPPIGRPSEKEHLTPLQLVAQLLNAPSTDIFSQDPRDGNTALHLAVKQGNAPVARYMLESCSPTSPGAIASAQWSMAKDGGLPQPFRSPWEALNHDGYSPAHLAVKSKHKVTVIFQLVSLCDAPGLNVVDASGKTVLDMVVEMGETFTPLVESIRELGGRCASELLKPSDLPTAASVAKDESSAQSSSSAAAIAPLPGASNDDPIAAYMFSKTTASQDPSPAATPFNQSVDVHGVTHSSSGLGVSGPHAPIPEERDELPMVEIDDPIAAYLSGPATSAAQPANSLTSSAAVSQRVNAIAEASQGRFASLATSQPPIVEQAEPSSLQGPALVEHAESETPPLDTVDVVTTSHAPPDPPQADQFTGEVAVAPVLSPLSKEEELGAEKTQQPALVSPMGTQTSATLIFSPSFIGTINTANGTPFASLPRTTRDSPESPRIVANHRESSTLNALLARTANDAPRGIGIKGSQQVSQSMDVFSSGSPMESVTALAVPSASSHKAPSVDALARDDSVQPPPLSDLLGSRLAEQEADADAGAPDNEEHDLDKPLTDDRTTDGIDMGGPSSLVLPSDIGNDPADVVDDEEIRALAEEFGVAELFDPTADGDNDQDQPLKSAQGSVGGEARDGEFASAEDLANTEDPELSMPFRSADASAVDEISASQAELASKLRSLELEEEAMLREVAASGKPGKPVVAYELSLSELGAMGTATDMSGFEATNSTDLLARLAQEEEELMAQIQQDSYGVDEDLSTRGNRGQRTGDRKRTATGTTTASMATSVGQRSRMASGMGM